ncbi:MAG: hypothetical protein AAFQ23_07170, partial [Cyanobacteria bacterium J06623_1]
RQAFNPSYLQQNDWLRQFDPEVTTAIANLDQSPAIAQKIEQCSIFSDRSLNLLTTQCLLKP